MPVFGSMTSSPVALSSFQRVARMTWRAAEPSVAVLEPHGRPAPAEHRDKLLKTALRVAFVNALPEDVTCGPAGLE